MEKNGSRVPAIRRLSAREPYLALSLLAAIGVVNGALAEQSPAPAAPAPSPAPAASPAPAPTGTPAGNSSTGGAAGNGGTAAPAINSGISTAPPRSDFPSGGTGATPGTGNPPKDVRLPDPAKTPTTTILSIDAAVQRALGQNPTLEQATSAVRRAEAVVAEARSFQLPRLDADARFTYQGPVLSFTIPGGTGTGTGGGGTGGTGRSQSIALGKAFTRQFDFTATYDPDPFGRLRANTRSTRNQLNATRGSFYAAQNELVYSVQNLYLAALRSQELIRVAQDAVVAAQEQLRVAQAQYRAGVSPEFDVLSASVQVRNLQQNQVTAEANLRRANSTLAQVLSLDPEARLELVPVALPPDPDVTAAATARELLDGTSGPGDASIGGTLPKALASALDEAFQRRPELYRADWTRRAAQARVEYERKGRYPSVGLTGSYLFTPDAVGLAAADKSWSIVANIAIPIWDAGLSQARTRQARADVETAAAQVREARDQITQEVRAGLIDLEDATERRRAAVANTTQAREALRIARVRYTAGLGTVVEVTQAETQLTQAQTNEVNAAYDYLAALANLNRALGRYADDRVHTALQ